MKVNSGPTSLGRTRRAGRNVITRAIKRWNLNSQVMAGICWLNQNDHQVMHELDSLLGRNRFLQHGGFFVSLQAKTVLALLLQTDEAQPVSARNAGCVRRVKSRDATCLFKDDVNVSGNKLGYLLSLCSLHRVVTLLVFSKILWRAWKGEGIQTNIYDPSSLPKWFCIWCDSGLAFLDRPYFYLRWKGKPAFMWWCSRLKDLTWREKNQNLLQSHLQKTEVIHFSGSKSMLANIPRSIF